MKLFKSSLSPNLAVINRDICCRLLKQQILVSLKAKYLDPEVNEREELVEGNRKYPKMKILQVIHHRCKNLRRPRSTDDIEQQEITPTPGPSPTPTVEPAEQATLENTLLTQLGSLRIEPEYEAAPYDLVRIPSLG